jgi:thiol-disulfide isomerase/thioredoxin
MSSTLCTNECVIDNEFNLTSIIYGIKTKFEFEDILKNNKGIIILKFQADWCGPCQKIKTIFNENINRSNFHQVYIIDVDECFEIYAFLKTKKMVKNIPTMLAYYKGNHSFISDDYVSGTDVNEINLFFDRCNTQNNKWL